MADPALSIVIPVYNRAASIGRTIASILAAAEAAGAVPGLIEMFVVDDGSTDGSAAAAKMAAGPAGGRVAVSVLRQPNGGPATARNAGSARARAPYLAFVDSDDVWFDWTLAACLSALAALPDAALVFLKASVFSEARPLAPMRTGGATLDVHDGFVAAGEAYPDRSFGTNNVIMRRDVFRRLGGFDVAFRCLEDTDLFLRADREGPCIVLNGDDLLGRRRGDGDSLTDNWRCVVNGLETMKARERAGRYPGGPYGDPRRMALFASTAVRASRLCFANGEPWRAYATFFSNLALILHGGRARWIWRLPLTPVLSLLRPHSFPFRMRPRAASFNSGAQI